ncbi:transketolase, partial [Helicobacter pylori]
GGSADLAPSNNTHLKHSGDFPLGQNLHFGIREHAMGAITNALAAYGLFLPFCATFFVFSDYLMPSMRLSALMKLKALFIFTHDSIGVGEDGATHQPVEQLSHLRALPHFYAFRPSD